MTRYRVWIGASTIDVALRLAAQLAGSVVLARILTPEEFGLATMALVVVTVMAALLGLPFEESISQRPRLRTAHLETVLAASFALTLAGVAGVAAAGPLVEAATGTPGFAAVLLVASLFLFAEGPRAIYRGTARRTRRFVDLAVCQAAAQVLASAAAIAAGIWGLGVYALVIQRMLPNLLHPVLGGLIWAWRGRRVWIAPRWHRARFREVARFSTLHLADVSVLTATPAVLAFLVNGAFGTAALGQLNVALRIVDPLRSGLLGIGHNLAFSALVGKQDRPGALASAAGSIGAGVAVIVMPAFVGLAATAPVLLPILVGPGWEAAVPLSQILCLAVAASLPLRVFHTGFLALGRPEYNLMASTLGMVALVAAFVAAHRVGLPHVAGVAFLAGEAALAAFVLAVAWRLADGGVPGALARMARVAGASAVMALAVSRLGGTGEPSLALLARMVALGVVVFAGALAVTCPACMRETLRLVRPRVGAG